MLFIYFLSLTELYIGGNLGKAKELCNSKSGPWTSLHSVPRAATLTFSCVCLDVTSSPLSSPPLFFFFFIYFDLSPSHCTVAMATILIDPVPSNTECFSKPKLKQSDARRRLVIKVSARAESSLFPEPVGPPLSETQNTSQ